MGIQQSPLSWLGKHLRSVILTVGIMGSLFLLISFRFSVFAYLPFQSSSILEPRRSPKPVQGIHDDNNKENTSIVMYQRLVSLASSALAEKEFRDEPVSLWKEPRVQASTWKPCGSRTSQEVSDKPTASSGFILVSANGGLNQQRVAVCNAVGVAALLNATLVIPKFLYSSVWKDPSQFADIYQEDYFIDRMNDTNIVKELPQHLRSVDLKAIGSVVTDSDLEKEAKPKDYIRLVLPLLLRNGLVHLLGFGNRLGFDPLPSHIQKLRCKCNFHALKFVPRIQKVGSLLVKRIRKYNFSRNMLDKQLLGSFLQDSLSQGNFSYNFPPKYLALHLRFEEDMLAHSLCEFGGGETEARELQAYREAHFPFLLERLKKNSKSMTPSDLRQSGQCPLTPEESALVLAALGFKHKTYIYLAGSHIYGGQSRMKPFTTLFPNLVTKEDLLSDAELEPLKNFSSQLAALDFIACAIADTFAMTDSGSQMSTLVSGFRTYFGDGQAPTLRPNHRRLALMLQENGSVGWSDFADMVKKMIEEGQRVRVRGYGKNLYRLPTTPECMCKSH